MDASNLLKPALARGELHCVGATTLDEYRKHVEKDAALARRFQPIFVNEPSVEDTISILRGIKEKYELHHGVRITDAAIVAAATLSNRYISDRFLPDKAIDLMDEAGSRLRMQVDSKPEELDELDRRIMQLQIEREALKKETDAASKDRLQNLEKDLADTEEKSTAMTRNWQAEKEKLASASKLKEELEAVRHELELAQRRGDFARAGELTYGRIPELQKNLEAAEAAGGSAMLEEAVTASHVGRVFPLIRCWRANVTDCWPWKPNCKSEWLAKKMRSSLCQKRSDVRGRVCKTPTGPLVHLCSLAPQVWVKPN
jgi:ATP-dependent Clp protease ATP-binding subunit ClpB